MRPDNLSISTNSSGVCAYHAETMEAIQAELAILWHIALPVKERGQQSIYYSDTYEEVLPE